MMSKYSLALFPCLRSFSVSEPLDLFATSRDSYLRSMRQPPLFFSNGVGQFSQRLCVAWREIRFQDSHLPHPSRATRFKRRARRRRSQLVRLATTRSSHTKLWGLGVSHQQDSGAREQSNCSTFFCRGFYTLFKSETTVPHGYQTHPDWLLLKSFWARLMQS